MKLVKVSQSQAPPCFSLMGFSFAKHLILLFLAKDTYTPSRSFMICLRRILLNAIFRITFAIFFVKGRTVTGLNPEMHSYLVICHSERREEAPLAHREILRYAQNDRE